MSSTSTEPQYPDLEEYNLDDFDFEQDDHVFKKHEFEHDDSSEKSLGENDPAFAPSPSEHDSDASSGPWENSPARENAFSRETPGPAELLQNNGHKEPIGIRTAQSILRKATQSNLSHFHVAGMEKTYQQNYPTIADAMDSHYSNENTSATFSVVCDKKNDARASAAKIIGSIRKNLVGKKLSWFVNMTRSTITELPKEENIWYESSDKTMFEKAVRIYIDYIKLVQFDFTLQDIAELCFPDKQWHASPDWMGMIDVKVVDNYTSILSNIDKLFCGDPCISSVHADIEDNDNVLAVKAVTAGSDIMNISRLPNVDKDTIRSNHVLDVYKHLGIEAAASSLREIIGSDVISDFMTRTGKVLSFQNSSPEVFKKGVLTAMAFERPRTHIRNFLKSAKWDKHPSIYADIMVGNNPIKSLRQEHHI